MKRSPLLREHDNDYAVTYLLDRPRPNRKPLGRKEKTHIAINVITRNFWWFQEGIGQWVGIDDAGPMAMHVKAEILGTSIDNGRHLTFDERDQFVKLLDNIRIDLEESLPSI